MKRSEKSRKASSIDAEKRKQAEFDLAIKERIRTAPAVHVYQPVPGPGAAPAAEGGVMIHGIKTSLL